MSCSSPAVKAASMGTRKVDAIQAAAKAWREARRNLRDVFIEAADADMVELVTTIITMSLTWIVRCARWRRAR